MTHYPVILVDSGIISVAQLIQEKPAHSWSLFSTFINKPIWRQDFYRLKRI